MAARAVGALTKPVRDAGDDVARTLRRAALRAQDRAREVEAAQRRAVDAQTDAALSNALVAFLEEEPDTPAVFYANAAMGLVELVAGMGLVDAAILPELRDKAKALRADPGFAETAEQAIAQLREQLDAQRERVSNAELVDAFCGQGLEAESTGAVPGLEAVNVLEGLKVAVDNLNIPGIFIASAGFALVLLLKTTVGGVPIRPLDQAFTLAVMINLAVAMILFEKIIATNRDDGLTMLTNQLTNPTTLADRVLLDLPNSRQILTVYDSNEADSRLAVNSYPFATTYRAFKAAQMPPSYRGKWYDVGPQYDEPDANFKPLFDWINATIGSQESIDDYRSRNVLVAYAVMGSKFTFALQTLILAWPVLVRIAVGAPAGGNRSVVDAVFAARGK